MISPKDLKKPEFNRALRGYLTEDVDAYIKYLQKCYNDAYASMNEFEQRYSDLYDKYIKLSEECKQVNSAVYDARVESKRIIDEANEKAELVVKASKANCDNIINDFRRIVGVEREKLIKLQSQLQKFKEKILDEYREQIDIVDDLTDIADSSLYYCTDDEIVAKALDEVKTDIRYAVAEKELLDNFSDDEVAVDLECFNEEPIDELHRIKRQPTRVDVGTGDETMEFSPEKIFKNNVDTIENVGSIGTKYMSFLDDISKQ